MYEAGPDENQAPFVPPANTPICYQCPNTNVDRHYYLMARQLGRQATCSKCGLAVTIGKRGGASALLLYFFLLLIGALVGFAVAMIFR